LCGDTRHICSVASGSECKSVRFRSLRHLFLQAGENMRLSRLAIQIFATFFGCRAACAADIVVTRFDDPIPDGCTPTDCSLREAVILSNAFFGPDRILLGTGTYTLSIFGAGETASQTGDLNIHDDLEVIGAGSATTIVRWALPGDRVFEGADDGNVNRRIVLAGMTIRGGSAPTGVGTHAGGGILMQGFLLKAQLSDIVLDQNSAPGGFGGGAAITGGSILLAGVTATGNRALRGGGLYVHGFDTPMSVLALNAASNTAGNCAGAEILASTFELNSTATLRSLNIHDNFADNQGGGLCMGAFSHGMVLFNSLIENNTAGNGGGNGNGGGILVEPASPDASSIGEFAEIRSSIIRNNTARIGSGGGIDVQSVNTPQLFGVELVSSTISGNHAADGDGGGLRSQPWAGGAVMLREGTLVSGNDAHGGAGIFANGSLTILDSTVEQNAAAEIGGGLLAASGSEVSILRSTISANTSGHYGGGIETFADNLTINSSTLDANKAPIGAGIDGNQKPINVVPSTLVAAPGDLTQGNLFEDIFASLSTPHVSNSILSGRCAHTDVTGSGNIESPGDTCGTFLPNVTAAQLALGPLADNGGPTLTHKLQTGSVAINAVPTCPPLDQRGYVRKPLCDIGSVETDGFPDHIFSDDFEL
jgi:hypothetical protein